MSAGGPFTPALVITDECEDLGRDQSRRRDGKDDVVTFRFQGWLLSSWGVAVGRLPLLCPWSKVLGGGCPPVRRKDSQSSDWFMHLRVWVDMASGPVALPVTSRASFQPVPGVPPSSPIKAQTLSVAVAVRFTGNPTVNQRRPNIPLMVPFDPPEGARGQKTTLCNDTSGVTPEVPARLDKHQPLLPSELTSPLWEERLINDAWKTVHVAKY
ncbi:hypothetical protein SKAU_G00043720 [Synaphobranchus kaupii]|uniref:Uncharacterized protein n=1 Tax=Synaphobranchus kaupii TaxID=118154 RepID=A0A9Q1G1N3_SYNKA|nr:hypothetical protein SKAU_G00043720 [Synaphobranchus kaupii]